MKHREPSRYSLAILSGLQSHPIFGGLNPNHPTKSTTKALAKRRAGNKAARRARRVNR